MTLASPGQLARLDLPDPPELLETPDHPDLLDPQGSLETGATLVPPEKRETLVPQDPMAQLDPLVTREL